MNGSENSDQAQIDRLWQHGLHEDGIFNERLNFFLVFESVLLGVIGMLLDKEPAGYDSIIILLIILGLAVTVIWAYVQAKQRSTLKIITIRLIKHLPEFKETKAKLELPRWRRLSGTALLAYGIPCLIGLVWIVLLFIALKRQVA